jgi:hypothetical protein
MCRPCGIRYSASLNAIPWSVGATRNTFGRAAGSITWLPPSKITPIGVPLPAAMGHEALIPVPSSTIATAWRPTARRTFETARAGDRPLSSVSIFRSYVFPPTWMPFAFTSRAASRAPFSIARPR